MRVYNRALLAVTVHLEGDLAPGYGGRGKGEGKTGMGGGVGHHSCLNPVFRKEKDT